MRNAFTISLLLLLIIAGFFLIRYKPHDAENFNPDKLSYDSHLVKPEGNVIWINLEGLRADHIGAYGYKNTTTPFLDSLAGESLLFERCYAQSTETYRSAVTMFTSRYPVCYSSSVKENVGMGFRDLITPPEGSLVTKLQNAGLTTCAVVSSRLLKREFGFNKGFDYYLDELVFENDGYFRIKNNRELQETADAWLTRNHKRPFFLYVQFSEPSGPYNPQPQFANQLGESEKYSDERILPVSPSDNYPYNQIPAFHNIKGDPPTVGEMIKRYDCEIAEADFYIGKIMHQIDQLGIKNKTMIVISSLHGESLGEHGYFFNSGGSTWHNLSHIPLIINLPGGSSTRIKDVVEAIDIMPTILNFTGVNPPDNISGMSLLGFSSKSKLAQNYPAFCYWDDPNTYSIFQGDLELINFSNNQYKLFNVINDPDEIYDMYYPENSESFSLERLLDEWLSVNHQRGLENKMREKKGPLSFKPPMKTPNPVSNR
jgi:arylsulfatase A-like enzyme